MRRLDKPRSAASWSGAMETADQRPLRMWPRRLWQWLVWFLYGDDVFISYSRSDGVRYATSLARELTRRELACRIDFLDTVPSREIPRKLRRAIQRSSLLAIVGSPGACLSPQVEAEIREFLPTRRNLVPIGFGRTVQNANWFPLVSGLTVEEEPEVHALETGVPAESVIKRIEDSCDFVHRDRRLRRTFRGTLAGTMLLVLLAGAWVLWSQRQAEEAERLASAADVRASAADERARAADATARSQGRLASARQTSAEIEGHRGELGYTPAADVFNAIQSGRELLSLGQPVEAAAVLSRSFSLLPQLHSRIEIKGGFRNPVLSTDGVWLAAIAGRTRVVIWQCPGLHEFPQFSFRAAVSALAFSLDGKTLAVASGEQVVVFDVASKAEIASLQSPGPVSRIRIGKDVKYVAGVSEESLFVWKLPEGELTTLPLNGEVTDMAFTFDSQLAVLIDEQGLDGDTLFLFDLQMRTWSPALESDFILVLSPDGQFVSSSCMDGIEPADCTTRVWRLPGLAEYRELPTHDLLVPAFSPDARYAATSAGGETRVWSTGSGLLLAAIPDSGEVVFSGDGSRLAVAGRRGVTSVYLNGITAAVLERPGLDPRSRLSLEWNLAGLSSRGRYAVLTNSRSGEIESWLMDGLDGGPGLLFEGDVLKAAPVPDGRLLVLTEDDADFFIRSEHVTIWEVETGEPRLRLPTSVMPAVSPDGSIAVYEARNVRLLSGRAFSQTRILARNVGLHSLTFVPGLGFAAFSSRTARDRSEMLLWDLNRSRVVARMPYDGRAAPSFTPDGRVAFSAASDGLRILDITGGSTAHFSKPGLPVSLVCPPSAGCLAAFKTEQALQIWSMDLDKLLLEIGGPVGIAILSHGGTYVAVQRGGAIEVWEIAGKRPLARRAAPAGLGYLGFTPDDGRLIAGIQRRLEMWVWNPEEALDAGCRRLRVNAASSAWSSLLRATEVEKLCRQ